MISDHIRIQDNEQNVRLDALESNNFEFNNTLKSTNTTMESFTTRLGETDEKFEQLSQDLNVKTASKINEVYHNLDKKIMQVDNVIDLSVKPGLTALQHKVDSQAGKIAQSESSISNLQDETKSNRDKITILQSETNLYKATINPDVKTQLDKLETKVESQANEIDEIESKNTLQDGNYNRMIELLEDTLEPDINALKLKFEQSENDISSLQSEAQSNKGKIDTLQSSLDSKHTTLQQSDDTLEQRLVRTIQYVGITPKLCMSGHKHILALSTSG